MEYGLVIVWLVTYVVLGVAALPLAGLLFPRFADRGGAFAIPLALAVLALVSFLVGHIAFGWPALLAGIAVLVSGWSLDDATSDLDYRRYAEAAAVFTVAFLLLVAIRGVDPAVHPLGGEKFLDFGLLKTLLRTGQLPPEDMWFAGEPVQYYYGGHLLASQLARFAGTAGAHAYNLALAGFYAALVTAAWGLASNVAAAADGPRYLAGGLGAFFAGLASNLATPARVLGSLLPDPVTGALVGVLGLPADVVGWTPKQFTYWAASRVIPRVPSDPDTGNLITEFPFFAWLNGDLHAHMMSTPFTLLVAALLFSYWLTPQTERRRRRLLVFGAIPPIAGLVAIVNTWSFPTTAGLTLLAVLFAPADPTTLLPDRVVARLPTPASATATPDATEAAESSAGQAERPDGGAVETDAAMPALRARLHEEATRMGTSLAIAVGMLVVAVVWALPFWLGAASGRPLAFFPTRSPLGGLLLVHGAFLLVFVPYLGQRWLAGVADPLRAVGMVALAALLAWLVGVAALALFVGLLLVAWVLLRERRDTGFETVLFVGGGGLVLLVEFVYVKEQAGPGRLNTVFKTYSQVWALWAPAAGVALARLATRRPDLPEFDLPADSEGWRRAGTVFAVVLMLITSLYAGFALQNHFTAGGRAASLENPTLDATAFIVEQHPDEAPAIAWIDSLEGQPTIVTAAPGGYFWQPSKGKGASAPASLTGVPTVVGWFHASDYHGSEPFDQRVADVKAIYTGSPTQQAKLLRQYDVAYIYVGPAERARYGTITVDQVPGVQIHKRFDEVVIYRVEQATLPT